MLKLGCIADDFSAARDLAQSLVAGGMRVVQTLGIPSTEADTDKDAIVVTLKTRYGRPSDAVVRALDALVWLKAQGVQQFYCCFSPTFNSVFEGEHPGNIGPVIDALMNALGVDFSVVAPSAPKSGVTVAKGYMFVGPVLLNECGLQNHPLTPMSDANLMRVLQAQTRHQVTLIDHVTVQTSSVAIQERMVELRLDKHALALIDASTTDDLSRIAQATKKLALVAGSAGLGAALPDSLGFKPSPKASRLPAISGHRAVLCASCAEVSNRQVEHFHAAGYPAMALDPLKISKFGAEKVAKAALSWAAPLLDKGPVLLYTSTDESTREAVANLLGIANVGTLIEDCMALIAEGMVDAGVRQLVIAGTDTAVGCLRHLGIRQMHIGSQVESGAPWAYGYLGRSTPKMPDGLHFLIKPGKRGSDDFFTRAFDWTR